LAGDKLNVARCVDRVREDRRADEDGKKKQFAHRRTRDWIAERIAYP
jgi:hypothetical protein